MGRCFPVIALLMSVVTFVIVEIVFAIPHLISLKNPGETAHSDRETPSGGPPNEARSLVLRK